MHNIYPCKNVNIQQNSKKTEMVKGTLNNHFQVPKNYRGCRKYMPSRGTLPPILPSRSGRCLFLDKDLWTPFKNVKIQKNSLNSPLQVPKRSKDVKILKSLKTSELGRLRQVELGQVNQARGPALWLGRLGGPGISQNFHIFDTQGERGEGAFHRSLTRNFSARSHCLPRRSARPPSLVNLT